MNTTTDNRMELVGRQTETCRGGNWLCPEAVRLWAAVTAAHAVASEARTAEAWMAYDEAHDFYMAHAPHQLVTGG